MLVGNRKLYSIKDNQSSESHCDDIGMVPCSEVLESHSKFTMEAQSEECGVGVASSGGTVVENPAYQRVDHM